MSKISSSNGKVVWIILNLQIIFHLVELANKNITIEKVHLFGATSYIDKYEWKNASEIIKYGIHNFYSKNDSVIKYLYQTAQHLSLYSSVCPLVFFILPV